MIERLRQILEMIRFSHTLFALPFAMLAALMAWVTPTSESTVSFRVQDLVGILIAMVGARSAAMAFNRLVDHKIDAANPRTANRHLPAGLLSRRAVIVFTIVSTAVYLLGALLFWPNYLPALFALPVLVVLLGYSYAKRFTSLAHFWLGFALGLAPVCAWIAIRGNEVIANPSDIVPSLVLGLAVMLWVAGFDMIYACQDYEFDRQAGLNSVPVRWGIRGALAMSAICHAAMVVALACLPFSGHWAGVAVPLGWPYFIAIGLIAALLLYEHALVRPDDLSRVGIAFFHVNAVVSIGLFAIGAIDLLAL